MLERSLDFYLDKAIYDEKSQIILQHLKNIYNEEKIIKVFNKAFGLINFDEFYIKDLYSYSLYNIINNLYHLSEYGYKDIIRLTNYLSKYTERDFRHNLSVLEDYNYNFDKCKNKYKISLKYHKYPKDLIKDNYYLLGIMENPSDEEYEKARKNLLYLESEVRIAKQEFNFIVPKKYKIY